MKTAYALLTTMVALTTGCSSDKKVEFTCVIATNAQSTCSELTVPSSQAEAAQASCTESGGSTTFDPCTTDSNLGKCSFSKSGEQAEMWFFDSEMVSTTVGAMTACTDLNGTFTPNDEADSNVPSTNNNTGNTVVTTTNGSSYSCTGTGFCAAFTGVTSSTLSSVDSDCDAISGTTVALATSACPTTQSGGQLAIGTCVASTTVTGGVPMTVHFYGDSTDLTSYEDYCTSSLEGTFSF